MVRAAGQTENASGSDEPDLRDRSGHVGPGSLRTCVATRAMLSPEKLIRFVVGPEGTLVPDLRRKLPGRGVWVALSRRAVEDAVKRKAFERSLKVRLDVPGTLADDIDGLMVQDCLKSLSMANKAGLVTTGFAKVEALIENRQVAAVIEAADGAEDGQRKIAQALLRSFGEKASELHVVRSFRGSDLELALGRVHVIHAALASGPASEGFLMRWRRLVLFRSGPLPVRSAEAAVSTV